MTKSVLTKQEIDQFEGVEKTHFLNSNAQRRNKSLGDLAGLTGIGFHLIEIDPGRESKRQSVTKVSRWGRPGISLDILPAAIHTSSRITATESCDALLSGNVLIMTSRTIPLSRNGYSATRD